MSHATKKDAVAAAAVAEKPAKKPAASQAAKKEATAKKKVSATKGRQQRMHEYKTTARSQRNQPSRRRTMFRGSQIEYPLTMRNYVLTAHLKLTRNGKREELPLAMIAECLSWYKSPKFTSIVYRSMKPFVTIELFSTDLMVVTGAKKKSDALLAFWIQTRKIARLLNTWATTDGFKVENMVASAAVGHKLNLRLFYADYEEKCMYSPEWFSAVRYMPNKPVAKNAGAAGTNPKKNVVSKPVVIVFDSGRMVLTGGTAWDKLLMLYASIDWSKYKLGAEYRQLELDPVAIRKEALKATAEGGRQRDAGVAGAGAGAGAGSALSGGAAADDGMEIDDAVLTGCLAAPKDSTWAEQATAPPNEEEDFALDCLLR